MVARFVKQLPMGYRGGYIDLCISLCVGFKNASPVLEGILTSHVAKP